MWSRQLHGVKSFKSEHRTFSGTWIRKVKLQVVEDLQLLKFNSIIKKKNLDELNSHKKNHFYKLQIHQKAHRLHKLNIKRSPLGPDIHNWQNLDEEINSKSKIYPFQLQKNDMPKYRDLLRGNKKD